MLVCLAHQGILFSPLRIHHRPGGTDLAAKGFCKFVEIPELLLAAHAPAAAHHNRSILDLLFPRGLSLGTDQSHAVFGQMHGHLYVNYLACGFIVVRYLLEYPCPHCCHLRPSLRGYDPGKEVAPESRGSLNKYAVFIDIEIHAVGCQSCLKPLGNTWSKFPAERGGPHQDYLRIICLRKPFHEGNIDIRTVVLQHGMIGHIDSLRPVSDVFAYPFINLMTEDHSTHPGIYSLCQVFCP